MSDLKRARTDFVDLTAEEEEDGILQAPPPPLQPPPLQPPPLQPPPPRMGVGCLVTVEYSVNKGNTNTVCGHVGLLWPGWCLPQGLEAELQRASQMEAVPFEYTFSGKVDGGRGDDEPLKVNGVVKVCVYFVCVCVRNGLHYPLVLILLK